MGRKKKKSKTARTHYVIAEFTPDERAKVVDHCKKEGVSVSSFLARVALQDLYMGSRGEPEEYEITITLKLPAEENARIDRISRRRGQTIPEFLRQALQPALKKGKSVFTEKTETLRCYLSEREHDMLMKYLKERKLSSRNYISYLALKELERRKKK